MVRRVEFGNRVLRKYVRFERRISPDVRIIRGWRVFRDITPTESLPRPTDVPGRAFPCVLNWIPSADRRDCRHRYANIRDNSRTYGNSELGRRTNKPWRFRTRRRTPNPTGTISSHRRKKKKKTYSVGREKAESSGRVHCARIVFFFSPSPFIGAILFFSRRYTDGYEFARS